MNEFNIEGYVSYNQAQELKKLGYQEIPEVWYRPLPKTDIEHYQGKNYKFYSIHNSEYIPSEDYLAPALDSALQWMEINYKLMVEIVFGELGFDFLIYHIFPVSTFMNALYSTILIADSYETEGYISEEDAKRTCLEQMIKIAKNQQ